MNRPLHTTPPIDVLDHSSQILIDPPNTGIYQLVTLVSIALFGIVFALFFTTRKGKAELSFIISRIIDCIGIIVPVKGSLTVLVAITVGRTAVL